MSTYNKGDLVRITGTFANAAGTNLDPDTVFFQVKDPAGVITLYTYGSSAVVRLSAGIYYLDVSVGTAGTWAYRVYSTGNGQAAGDNYFSVVPGYV